MQTDNQSNKPGSQPTTGASSLDQAAHKQAGTNKADSTQAGNKQAGTAQAGNNQAGNNQAGNNQTANPWQASNKGQSGSQQRGEGLSRRPSFQGGMRSGGAQPGQGLSAAMRAGSQGGSNQGCSIQGNDNVGSTERIISAGLGGLLVAGGIVRGRLPGLLLTAVGASLLYRGLSGYCALYQQLGITTNEMDDEHAGEHFFSPDHKAIKGVKIEEEFEIDQSPHELYEMWTKWEQLPQYLPHIKKIDVLGEGRTRWTAFAPLGVTLTWEAETIKQEADRMVSWKSVKGDVGTAGSVHFDDAGSGKTRMRVSMQYDPPGGKATAQVAEFFGIGLDRRVRDDLQQFKDRLESRSQHSSSR